LEEVRKKTKRRPVDLRRRVLLPYRKSRGQWQWAKERGHRGEAECYVLSTGSVKLKFILTSMSMDGDKLDISPRL